MQTVDDYRQNLPQTGRIEWIGLSPERRAELNSVETAHVEPGTGLVGDHHATSGRSKRQVTLIQHEHLAAAGLLLGQDQPLDPLLLRRNLVVSGINLTALRGARFRIGEDCILEGTGPCAPCSRMEENLGPGGYNAMRGHGGLTAVVIEGGRIRLGDPVSYLGLAVPATTSDSDEDEQETDSD